MSVATVTNIRYASEKNDALIKMALLTLEIQKGFMCWDPFFYGVTCSELGYKLSLQVRHCFRHIQYT